MPHKPARACRYPGCVCTTLSSIGYCEAHSHHYQPPRYPTLKDSRPSAAARGYNSEWQAIRAMALAAAGIPRDQWGLYDVHHDPPYNPAIEPDHRKYNLTPLPRSEHSRVTARGRRAR